MDNLPNSLGTTHVESSYYSGPSIRISVLPDPSKEALTPTPQEILDLPRLESFIPEGGPYHDASTSMVQNHSFAWRNDQNAQTWQGLTDYSITYTKWNGYRIFSSSGRKDAYLEEDLNKYGYVTNSEESMDRMDGLLAEKPLVEYVELPAKSQGLIVFPEEKRAYSKYSAMPDVELFVKEAVPYGDMLGNNYGRDLSKTFNGELRVRRNLFIDQFSERPTYDPETESYTILRERALNWARYLMTNDIDEGRDVKGFGVVDLSDENALGATIDKSILTLAENLESVAWRRAEARGLSGREAEEFVESYINSVIEHELYHFNEPDVLSKTASETRAGKLQSRHYGEQAKLREGTLQGKIDGILARHYAAYEKAARTGNLGSAQSLSKLEQLAEEYEVEAVASGIKDVADYVDNKLEEYIGKESGVSDESELADKTENSETSDVAYKAEAETYAEDSENNDSSDNADADGTEAVETAAESE